MSSLATLTPAERHRAVAEHFGSIVDGVTDWSAATPVAEWRAADVPQHLLDWFPGFLAGGSVSLPEAAAGDLPTAWRRRSVDVQALFEHGDRAFSHPHVGTLPLAEAIDRFYTADVFMHTWDLARASGQDDRLDPDFCQVLLTGMEPIGDVMRASGQYGLAHAVEPDAPVQERLVAFIGRDPHWRA